MSQASPSSYRASLLSPGSYKGLASLPDQLAVAQGFLRSASNVRYSTGVVSLRAGMTLVQSAPAASGTFKGCHIVERPGDGVSSGFAEVMLALSVSGKTRVYFSQWSGNMSGSGGSFGSWVEMTAGSGKYGDSRRTDPEAFGAFASVPRNDSYDVVFQSGTDDPVQCGATGSGTACAVKEVAAPTWASTRAPEFGPGAHVTMTDTGKANTAEAVSGATFAVGAANAWDFTVGAAQTAGNTIKVYQTDNSASYSWSGQVWVVMSAPDESVIRSCKVHVVNSSGTVGELVHDPTVSDQSVVVPTGSVDTAGRPVWLVAFASTTVTSGFAGIQLTATKSTTSGVNAITPGTVSVFALMLGGAVPGFAQYGVCYRSSGSRAESGLVVMRPGRSSFAQTKTVQSVLVHTGGASTPSQARYSLRTGVSATPGTFVLPMDVSLLYAPTLRLKSAVASTSAPVDQVCVYRKDHDSDEYLLVTEVQSAEYTAGAWANYTSTVAFASLGGDGTLTDGVASDSLGKAAPDARNEQIPRGLAMCAVGRRLYVGSKAVSTADGGSVCASDADFPTRFRRVVGETGADGGFESKVGEGEDVLALAASPGQALIGASSVLAWTGTAMYRLNGLGVTKALPYGVKSASSVCELGGAVLFVDQHGVHRRYAARHEPLSRWTVQDAMDSVHGSQRGKTWGTAWKDRAYLFLTTSSSWSSPTTKALVWSSLLDGYESLDTYHASAPQPVAALAHGAAGKMYVFTTTGDMYSYEDGATDAGQLLTMSLQFPAFRPGKGGDLWRKPTARGWTFAVTDQSGRTVTFTVTGAGSGSSVSATAALTGATQVAWGTTVSQAKGLTDFAVVPSMSLSAQYPFSVYEVALDVAEGGDGPAGYSA